MSNEYPTILPSRESVSGVKERVEKFLADQRERSKNNQPLRVEDYLQTDAALATQSELVLDLIYNEIVLRESRGEKPTLEEYVTRFPHLSESLKLQFEVDGVMGDDPYQTGGGIAGETITQPAKEKAAADSLANYEILEVLGRGGMGVVYKARQKSLNRIVALKMVRSGAHAGSEDLQRFRIEAEAVGRLQHPNIVQIYEVGETDDGPFLALEFIDGGSLAGQLEHIPWEAYKAARLTETLARAMHYAHQRGIIHRDLKPANILMHNAEDRRQETEVRKATLRSATSHSVSCLLSPVSSPKITDFGLAKMLVEGSQGPTQTGDFLGTPCYTAPEQASGRLRDIGPATDVYSLGAILYELLTGRPPFEGATILDTLDQVRSKDPTPPSRMQIKVPRDLETICLKCLEKDPRRRYINAELLAEDLERFLIGQPILARPVGFVERTVKWARRRPWAAVSLALTFVLIIGGFIGSWSYIYHLRIANEATEKQRLRAEANLLKAVQAVRKILVEVAAVDLADVPQLEGVRKNVLLEAKGMMDEFLIERGEDPTVRHLAGRAYASLGDIHDLLDESAAAEKAFTKAIALLESETPSPDQRRELARTLNNLGVLYKKLGRFAEAEKALDDAVARRKRIAEEAAERSELAREVAESHYHLGTVLARLPKRGSNAETEYREALALQDKLAESDQRNADLQRERARTMNNLGILLRGIRPKDTENYQRKAAEILEDLVAERPLPAYRRDLGRTLNNLAAALWSNGNIAQAEDTYGQAIELLKQLAADFSRIPIYRQELAGTYRNRALFYEHTKRLTKADVDYQESLRIRAQLVKDFEQVPEYKQGLAKVYADLAQLRVRQNLFAEADKNYSVAVSILEEIATPGSRPIYHRDLALTWLYRSILFTEQGRFRDVLVITPIVTATTWPSYQQLGMCFRAQRSIAEAPLATAKCIQHLRIAREADPRNQAFQADLFDAFENLVKIQRQLGNYSAAAAAAKELPRIYDNRPPASRSRDYILAAKYVSGCCARIKMDVRLTDKVRETTVLQFANEAIELLKEAKKLGDLPINELRTAPEFEAIRARPEFEDLIKQVQANPVSVT